MNGGLNMAKAKEQTQVINVRLLTSEIERLDELAQADDRSRSSFVRRLILSALDGLRDNDP